jgi:hypothetical protein
VPMTPRQYMGRITQIIAHTGVAYRVEPAPPRAPGQQRSRPSIQMAEAHLTGHLRARFQLFWPFCSRNMLSAVCQKWRVLQC